MPSMVLGPLRDDEEQNERDGWAVGPGLSLHYCHVLRGSSWAEASQAAAWERCGLDISSYTLL